jgi:dihydroorotate dehydrogenase electron transfer subunit
LTFLIREVGPGTKILTSLNKGDQVRVIGPLGQGLDDLEPNFLSQKWYLVAGGAGLGPMGSLVEALGPKAKLFYGERSGPDQVRLDYLKSWFKKSSQENIVATTEDGTGYGRPGLVTQPLIQSLALEKRAMIACGPKGLLAALAKIAQQNGLRYLALAEERMACGLGVCLSCSLPKLDGSNFRVCQDGPLVDGLSLDWESLRA